MPVGSTTAAPKLVASRRQTAAAILLACGLLASGLSNASTAWAEAPAAPASQASNAAPAQVQVYRPQVGQPHVDFVLPRISDRAPVRLSDYRGRKLLLIQFASW